ncbi:DNA cytosine methyltransferase [Candidatus Korobacter versatilis]|nr:DNA cytosine methyltransferase [Candidatus Koribacter versatilis]
MKRRDSDSAPFLLEVGYEAENPWRIAESQPPKGKSGLVTLELCAGAGGQALGLEQAGINHVALVEINKHACETLRLNRPNWKVVEGDLQTFDPSPYKGADIVSAGLPCPPFSVAGKQLGKLDERNLFPAMVNVVDAVRPRAVMVENVRGILDAVFIDYREHVSKQLRKLGYTPGWHLMNACEFGVPQLRPRVVFVAMRKEYSEHFAWPRATNEPQTVGDVLFDLMSARGWKGVKAWRAKANEIAPTIVGGSLKHGGPDLGPTRARRAWEALGVDGKGIADDVPEREFVGMPRLTVRMVARIQGFPDEWQFAGRKTQAYRQVGNAFPPPFARAVAESVSACLSSARRTVRVTSA